MGQDSSPKDLTTGALSSQLPYCQPSEVYDHAGVIRSQYVITARTPEG